MASPYDLTHAGQRPAKRPYVDNRTAALAAATAQFDSLVREQAHQEEIDAAVQLATQQQQQFASTPASQFAPVNNEPPKRKITRKRQVLSCRPCTTRKIRCTRTNGPGAPCQSCEKRGEAALCDVGGGPGGTTPAPSPGPSSTVAAAASSYGQQTPQQQQQQHHHHHHHHRHPHHASRGPSPGSMLPALPPALAAAAAASASPGPFAYGQVLPPPMHHAINIASPGSLDSYVVAVPLSLASGQSCSRKSCYLLTGNRIAPTTAPNSNAGLPFSNQPSSLKVGDCPPLVLPLPVVVEVVVSVSVHHPSAPACPSPAVLQSAATAATVQAAAAAAATPIRITGRPTRASGGEKRSGKGWRGRMDPIRKRKMPLSLSKISVGSHHIIHSSPPLPHSHTM